MAKIEPAKATDLPWKVTQPPHDPQAYDIATEDGGVLASLKWYHGKQNATYIVRACNSYPRLVALMAECLQGTTRGCHEWNDDARQLLRELGEIE